jgi:hypothetical protein
MKSNKIGSLTNFQIDSKLEKYKSKGFIGTFMKDKIPIKEIKNHPLPLGLVINLDNDSGPGTHWVCLFITPLYQVYFDSFGQPPPIQVMKLMSKFKSIPKYYNSTQLQQLSSQACGYFVIFILEHLFNGGSPSEIILNNFDQYPSNHNENVVSKINS